MREAQIKRHNEVMKNKEIMTAIIDGVLMAREHSYKEYDTALIITVKLKNAGFIINRIRSKKP